MEGQFKPVYGTSDPLPANEMPKLPKSPPAVDDFDPSKDVDRSRSRGGDSTANIIQSDR
jgi:hypothetical protein